MAQNKMNIAKGILFFIVLCGVFGLKYAMIAKSSPCIIQCDLEMAMNESEKSTCVTNCKLASLPKNKFFILSVIVITGFLLMSNLINNIVIMRNPKYIEKFDIFMTIVNKRLGNKSPFGKLISSNDDENNFDDSPYIRLFDN